MIVNQVDINYGDIEGFLPVELNMSLNFNFNEADLLKGVGSPDEILPILFKIHLKNLGFNRDVSISEILKKAYPQDFI